MAINLVQNPCKYPACAKSVQTESLALICAKVVQTWRAESAPDVSMLLPGFPARLSAKKESLWKHPRQAPRRICYWRPCNLFLQNVGIDAGMIRPKPFAEGVKNMLSATPI